MAEPVITEWCFLSMRICVPKEFTDEQVVAYAEKTNPAGTMAGWRVRKECDYPKDGSEGGERVQCVDHGENEHVVVHV